MRYLLVRAAVFAVIFFLAGLAMRAGSISRLTLQTAVATAVYLGFNVLFRRVLKK